MSLNKINKWLVAAGERLLAKIKYGTAFNVPTYEVLKNRHQKKMLELKDYQKAIYPKKKR